MWGVDFTAIFILLGRPQGDYCQDISIMRLTGVQKSTLMGYGLHSRHETTLSQSEVSK